MRERGRETEREREGETERKGADNGPLFHLARIMLNTNRGNVDAGADLMAAEQLFKTVACKLERRERKGGEKNR